jgi:hypothetical protein
MLLRAGAGPVQIIGGFGQAAPAGAIHGCLALINVIDFSPLAKYTGE